MADFIMDLLEFCWIPFTDASNLILFVPLACFVIFGIVYIFKHLIGVS